MDNQILFSLVAKAQAGDQAAMEEVLRTAHTSVFYQCRKLLRDPRNVEDTTQEILLTVYTKLHKLKSPAAFWGWLNTMTANRCMDVLKRDHVDLQFAEDEDGHSILDDLEELDAQQIPDKALDNAETTRMIEEIVNGLPEAQRICVLMYYYDEMSIRDIAQIIGVPENTVKSRLNYARKAIKEQVLDYEKKGVKLYGLSPLPFLLYFLDRAARDGADVAMAGAAARQVMALGASEAATLGSVAAGGSAAGTTVAATSAAVSHALGGLSVKLVAGVLAGLLVAGGVTGAVLAARNTEEPEPTPPPAITETIPVETEPEESVELPDEPIPAERLALLSEIAYYGNPAQCRITVNQARAYAQVIETRTAEVMADSRYSNPICSAALGDIGEGYPVLLLLCGSDEGEAPYREDPSWRSFYGKMEVWRYADGQAEMVSTAHQVYWKAGEGLVCHSRVSGTEGNNFPYFSVDAYSVEGGMLSRPPIASALVEVIPDFSVPPPERRRILGVGRLERALGRGRS